jgi:CRISPR-associated protein Cas2
VLIVISYDIPSDHRRNRLATTLKDFGRRVQLSVFECLLEPADVERLRGRVLREIDPAEDRVRIYRLCESCREKIEILGHGDHTEDPEIFVL